MTAFLLEEYSKDFPLFSTLPTPIETANAVYSQTNNWAKAVPIQAAQRLMTNMIAPQR